MDLDTIAEVHPSCLLASVMDTYGYDSLPLARKVFTSILESSSSDSNSSFLDSLKSHIMGSIRTSTHENDFEKCLDEAYLRLSLDKLDIAQEILEEEARILRTGRYRVLYQEGISEIIGKFAEDIGIKVTYLDSDNPYYNLLGEIDERSPEYFGLSVKREEAWVERINEVDDCLLNVGAKHVKGFFGLDTKLAKKGIELKTIRAFDETYLPRINLINTKLKSISLHQQVRSVRTYAQVREILKYELSNI